MDVGALPEGMLDASVDCIKVIDLAGALLYMNRPGCEALGLSDQGAAAGFGMDWLGLLPPESRRRGRRALERAAGGKPARFAGRSEQMGGAPVHWDNILTPLKNEDGETVAILCVSREVTAQREAERRLRMAGELDGLTGALNRQTFRARLSRAVATAREADGAQIGLILLDLDHFKVVNDTFGHPAGDHLLRTLSRRLAKSVPGPALIGRLGGDEFAVAMPGCAGEMGLRRLATTVASQLTDPVVHEGRPIRAGMSLGCALFPSDAGEVSRLMTCADLALREVKADQDERVAVFVPSMLTSYERGAKERRLAREVTERDALVPLYRPIMPLDGGSAVGLTSLMAWRSDGEELRSATHLGAAIEDDQLAPELHRAMRAKVLADIVAWRERGLTVPRVSLPVAPVEFLREDFTASLLASLSEHGAPTCAIELEIAEFVFRDRWRDPVDANLDDLRRSGVRVAIAGFGTGELTLARLPTIQVDAFRLDPRFVAGIGEDDIRVRLVGGVTTFADAMSVDVVANGVGTEAQRDALVAGGCRFGIGDFFGVPTDATHAIP